MAMTRRTLLATTGALAVAAPVRAAEKTRVTLWHAMSAALGEELNKLIAAFNASQDGVELIAKRNRGHAERSLGASDQPRVVVCAQVLAELSAR